MNPSKRVAAPAVQGPMISNKPKEPPRLNKPVPAFGAAISTVPGSGKIGPTSFRTVAETTSIIAASAQTTTITLVNPQAERRPLGPPSRPSAMAQPLRQSTAVQQSLHNRASTVLQQSRVALQSQLDEKAIEIQSEDIVLPDIASEYVKPLLSRVSRLQTS